MLDPCHYASGETHRMHDTKSELYVNCGFSVIMMCRSINDNKCTPPGGGRGGDGDNSGVHANVAAGICKKCLYLCSSSL